MTSKCPSIIHSAFIQGNCEAWQFKCESGECVTAQGLCDGKRDCTDGSDEIVEHCAASICPRFGFKCGYGACISDELKCNGKSDCADDSDESESLCSNVLRSARHKRESPVVCGLGPAESNITGAIDVAPNVPWHVTILNKNGYPHCSGTILSEKLVLSAMTCFWQRTRNEEIPLEEFTLAVGQHPTKYTQNEESASQFLGIQKIVYKDDKYDLLSKDHTPVILLLNDYVYFRTNVYPICFSSDTRSATIQGELQGRLSTNDLLNIFILKPVQINHCINTTETNTLTLYNGSNYVCNEFVNALRKLGPEHTGSSFITATNSKRNQYFLKGIFTNNFDDNRIFADIQFYLDFIVKTILKYT